MEIASEHLYCLLIKNEKCNASSKINRNTLGTANMNKKSSFFIGGVGGLRGVIASSENAIIVT